MVRPPRRSVALTKWWVGGYNLLLSAVGRLVGWYMALLCYYMSHGLVEVDIRMRISRAWTVSTPSSSFRVAQHVLQVDFFYSVS